MQIKISDVKINPGRRDTQQRNVEELARSIAAVGLMNPINVTQDNKLIAGLHRLKAVKLLGWTEIECTVSDADGLQAELAEIDENFVRAGLSHRELGDLLLRRKELYEAIYPETRQGQRNGQTVKNGNLTVLEAKPFSEDTADLESLLKEFKAHAQRFISGMTAFDQQADMFARMSYVQSNELWNSAVAVTDVIRAFSKKVNHIKDELQGDHSLEN